MSDKFLIAADADSKLRKLREAETKSQRQESIFAIAAGLAVLALIYASSFAFRSYHLKIT